MAGSTDNYDLYIWEASDEKRETIDQIANNARKIDSALNNISNKVDSIDLSGVNADIAEAKESIDALEGDIGDLRADINRLRNIEGWKDLSLAAAVTAYGAGFVNPSYRKDPYGMVFVRGLIKLKVSGDPNGDVDLATLPAGYRPKEMMIAMGWASLVGGVEEVIRINVRTDGRIQARTGTSGAVYISLDSIQPFEGA